VKAPSKKRLLAAFRDLTPEQADLIRKLAHATDDVRTGSLRGIIAEQCPETHTYAMQCYHDPFNSYMWRVTMALHAIDRILGTHGVEPLGPVDMHSGPPAEYCNVGDPYTATLIYVRDADELRIGCWGDLVERHPETYDADA
jgi:hypothetical protein